MNTENLGSELAKETDIKADLVVPFWTQVQLRLAMQKNLRKNLNWV